MFSGSRAQKVKPGRAVKGILVAAREGAGRDALIRAALEELLASEGVERAGVWLEETPGETPPRIGISEFRGEVWDMGDAPVPVEWKRLSTESPLPPQLLNEKKAIEYDTCWETGGPMFGPLVGLARVLWVPVRGRSIVRGLLLAGTSRKRLPLPRHFVERVAAELEFVLEFEEERGAARAKQSDLSIWHRVEDQLARQESFEAVFAEIAESCRNEADPDGPGAVFALIGQRKIAQSVSTPSSAGQEESLEILAQSGDPAWVHSLDNGPLETLWRRAVQDAAPISAEANRLPLVTGISRLIAIPLWNQVDVRGVLIAGMGHGRPVVESIPRLELRAQLASSVLVRVQQQAFERRRLVLEKALFELSGEPCAIVDRGGFLAGMSRGARDLTKEREVSSGLREQQRFAQLFRPRDWEEVDHWLKLGFASSGALEDLFPEAELRAGKKVRLRRLGIFQEQFVAIRLEPLQLADYPRSLEDLELEFRQVLAWVEEGVAVFDAQGRLRANNARFLQMLGLPERETLELHTLDHLISRAGKNAADPDNFAAAWRELANGHSDGVKDELLMERPIAQVLERFTKALLGNHGQALGRVEVYREVHGRNLFESRMAQTEQLASLGQRISGIVHDLSSPLTNILLLAQRLARHEADGNRHPDTQQILLESGRATAILRQMLDLTRERRRERQLVSLNQVVTQSVELQRAMLSGSRIALHINLEEKLPAVEGDFGQLQQVLLNLLQNAQQAIEESTQGSRIEVRTSRESEGRVRLEVRDDGPGIPVFLQAKVFDPFFTTKPPNLGTGLGLSIVLGFVRQHGGTVWAQPQATGGTSFVVELPVAHHDSKVSSQPSITPALAKLAEPVPAGLASAAISNGKPHHGSPLEKNGFFSPPRESPNVLAPLQHKRQILVIEDEPTVAGLIADVLREENMEVDVLADASAALLQVERKTYDLAICDLKMPGMDGQDFYRILGERGNSLQDHVLFVTGDIIAARTQKFLEQHRLAYCAKPFRMEELLHAVREMLWRGPQPQPQPKSGGAPETGQVQKSG